MKAPTKTMDTVQIYIQNSMQHTMKRNAISVHIYTQNSMQTYTEKCDLGADLYPNSMQQTLQIAITVQLCISMKTSDHKQYQLKHRWQTKIWISISDFLYQRELNADMDFNEEISDHKHISTKTQRTKRKIWISIYTRENLKTQIWISMKKLRFSTSKKT